MAETQLATNANRLHDDESGLADNVSLDFDSIPAFVKDDLAAAALDAFMRFLQRPDAQAILDAERELLRREDSTLLEPRLVKLKGAKT